jgi:catechol 2,3-dioxygenase-like lactoylglutathione lyase family enzyme
MTARLVPELDVSDLERSLTFYVEVCGFSILYERPAERFAYLELDGAELMLQAADGPGRRFRTAALEAPYGRGINLQIEVAEVEPILARILQVGAEIVVSLEERWYPSAEGVLGNRQLVVADPDGYLLRLFEDLGSRAG